MLQVPPRGNATDFASRRQIALERIQQLIAHYEQLAHRAFRNYYVLQGLTIGLAAITPCLIALAKDNPRNELLNWLQLFFPALAALCAGLSHVFKFREDGVRYTTLAEGVRSQLWRYQTRSGELHIALTDDQALDRLVVNVDGLNLQSLARWSAEQLAADKDSGKGNGKGTDGAPDQPPSRAGRRVREVLNEPMRIICTGISGTVRMDLLRQVVELARARGRDVRLYDVWETMAGIARAVGEPVEEETILDMFPRALILLRAAALEQICSAIESDPDRDWILNTHAVFRWKNTLISGFDPHYLTRLNPHVFVTVTAGSRTSQARLGSHARWAHLTQEEVLTWREEEQFFTEEMARIHRKPQFLLPRAMTADVCYQLMFEPERTRAYLSYPMQHVVEGAERGLAAFKARLAERLIVFDPGDVNDFAVEGASAAAAETSDGSIALQSLRDTDSPSVRRDPLQQHIADQIVERDYKLIGQSEVVVVYYDVPVPSPGVISEMKFALENGKRVYGVWLPNNEPSVFFTRYCSLWFRTPEALFRQLWSDVQPGAQDQPVVAVSQR